MAFTLKPETQSTHCAVLDSLIYIKTYGPLVDGSSTARANCIILLSVSAEISEMDEWIKFSHDDLGQLHFY